MSHCAECNKKLSSTIAIACCKSCNNLYHASQECTGLSATEIRVIELKTKSLVFKCASCASCDNPADIGDLKELFRDLSVKVDKIVVDSNNMKEKKKQEEGNVDSKLDKILQHLEDVKIKVNEDIVQLRADIKTNFVSAELLNKTKSELIDRMDSIKSASDDKFVKIETELAQLKSVTPATENMLNKSNLSSSQDNNFHQIFKEAQLRINNSMNVIIHNLDESPLATADDDDRTKIINALKDIQIETNLQAARFYRIGSRSLEKVRSIKLQLNSRSDVTKILKNWRKLPQNLKANEDHTKMQRDQYKILKNRVDDHNLKNPEDLQMVIFDNGCPKIVIKKVKPVSEDNQNLLKF